MHVRVLSAILVLLVTATAPAAPALLTTPAIIIITNTGAARSNTSAPATGTSAPTTGTSEPNTSSNGLLPSSSIPPGYTYYPATKSAYKFHHQRFRSWQEANTTCAGEGAHVVVLNDAQEADIVARIMMDAVDGYYATWIGLRDYRPGGVMDWRTIYGEPISDVFNVWAGVRPLDEEELTCAVFTAYYKKLADKNCDAPFYFTCEISQQ